jgi:O-antigen ligase
MNARWSARLLGASRLLCCVSLALAYLSPSWQHGTYALWPLGAVRLLGHDYEPGALLLAPLGAGLTWLAGVALGQRWRAWRWPDWRVALPALGLGALALLRVWPVHDSQTAFVTVTSIGFFWALALYAHLELSPRWLATALAAVLAVQGALAIGQFARQGPLGLTALGEATLWPEAQGAHVLLLGGQRWLRAQGMAPHPNVLGGHMALGLLVTAGRALMARRRIERGLLLAAMALGAAGLFLSFSRSAWVALLVGLLHGGWRLRHTAKLPLSPVLRRRLWWGLGALALIAAVGLALRLRGLGNPLEQTSVRERLEDYGLAWTLIRARPLTGVGSGYYIAALWAAVGNQMPAGFPGFRTVHNVPLLAAAELGVPGAALWLWLLLGPALARSRASVPDDPALVSLSAAFLAALLLSLFDVYLYLPNVWWSALVLGALAGAWSHGRAAKAADGR